MRNTFSGSEKRNLIYKKVLWCLNSDPVYMGGGGRSQFSIPTHYGIPQKHPIQHSSNPRSVPGVGPVWYHAVHGYRSLCHGSVSPGGQNGGMRWRLVRRLPLTRDTTVTVRWRDLWTVAVRQFCETFGREHDVTPSNMRLKGDSLEVCWEEPVIPDWVSNGTEMRNGWYRIGPNVLN